MSADALEDVAQHLRRQSERWLVQQEDSGALHQCHRHFQDLLLASGEISRQGRPLLGQHREALVQRHDVTFDGAIRVRERAHLQVLVDGHYGKVAAALRYQRDALAQDLV